MPTTPQPTSAQLAPAERSFTPTLSSASQMQNDSLSSAAVVELLLERDEKLREEAKAEKAELEAKMEARQVELEAQKAELEAKLSPKEAISAEQTASNLKLEQAHGARELVREGEKSATAEEMLVQLRAALATESSRVAAAWEQRERMRAVVAERDGTLRQLQTERFHLSEDLAASREQIAQLQDSP